MPRDLVWVDEWADFTEADADTVLRRVAAGQAPHTIAEVRAAESRPPQWQLDAMEAFANVDRERNRRRGA